MRRLLPFVFVLFALPAFAQTPPPGAVQNNTTAGGGSSITTPVSIANGGTGSATGAGLVDRCNSTTGSDAFACSVTTCPASLAAMRPIIFMPTDVPNTGNATLNFCSLGAKNVVKTVGGISTTLADNDILAKQPVLVVYNSVDDNFKMISAVSNASSGGANTALSNLAAVAINQPLTTGAGTAASLTATPPAATTGVGAQTGIAANLTASVAVADNSTAGAGVGGTVTITSGAAARLTSGNANGGSIRNVLGTGIGTGTIGRWELTPCATRNLGNIATIAESAAGGFAMCGNGELHAVSTSAKASMYAGGGGAPSFSLASTGQFAWAAGTDSFAAFDTIITRESAATVQLGVDVNGTGVAQTVKAPDGITGSNVAGGRMILAAGRGTGNATSGNNELQTAPKLASGTAAQVLETRLMVVAGQKDLTDNTVATFGVSTLGNDTFAGGTIQYCVYAADATTSGVECGAVDFAGTDVTTGAGGETCSAPTKVGTPVQALSGSTLTVTFAATTGTDLCNWRITADTNIVTPVNLYVKWNVPHNSGATFTPSN